MTTANDMKTKEELDQVWDMLHRAMMVINDLAGHYEPNLRLRQEIDDLLEGIHELEGPQE
jgi:hypothetical protein